MLENASENTDNRGTLSGWNTEDVAECFNVTVETVVTVCNAMQQKTVSGDQIIAWEKRNPKRERADSSTERVRKFREKKRNETPGNATKRPEKRREDKIREEKKKEAGKSRKREPTEVPESLLYMGEFQNVGVTQVELGKLQATLNGHTGEYIERLSGYLCQIGPKKAGTYRSHYATILNWWRRDLKDGKVSDGEHENPNTRAARDFVNRELARTIRPNIPDVREDAEGALPETLRRIP